MPAPSWWSPRAAAAGSATPRSPRRARKAPGFALLGEEGETRTVTLELKVVADVGLVGFPSAGKSSLVAAISRARPKIADYPFTTLVPNLGVVVAGEVTYTVADVPGLIEGASEGRGLGHDFLRHIERCAALVHVIDCATFEPGRDPLTDLDVIEAELAAHGGLEDRPRLVALNKIDIPDARELAEIVPPDLRARGLRVFPISTKSGDGSAGADASPWPSWSPRAGPPCRRPRRPGSCCDPAPVGGAESSPIRREGELWRVRGDKPERWVRQTDFGNPEAVGYLADRLNRIGIEDRLLELGARAGDGVAIGGEDAVVFDFAPQVDIGAEILSRRGEDQRFTEERPAAIRRREKDGAYHADDEARASSDDDWSRGRLSVRQGRATIARPEIAAAHRVVVKVGSSSLTTADRRHRPGPDPGAGGRAGRRSGWPAARSCWSPPGPSPPGWRRWACGPGRGTWPPSRPRPRWVRAC